LRIGRLSRASLTLSSSAAPATFPWAKNSAVAISSVSSSKLSGLSSHGKMKRRKAVYLGKTTRHQATPCLNCGKIGRPIMSNNKHLTDFGN
jgi:hypothetical protein